MSRQRKNTSSKKNVESQAPTEPTRESARSFQQIHPVVRGVVSALLILHLFAVVLAPLSMMFPAQGLVEPTRRKFEPYHQATYLGHGYQFFAPDPGPSHFVEYVAFDEQNKEIARGRFPDRDQHWPRLFYHRWFMLSERTYELNRQRMPDKEFVEMIERMDRDIEQANQRGDTRIAQQLRRDQVAARETHLAITSQSDRLTRAIEDEIKRRHQADRVELTCVERLLPAPSEVAIDKRKLDDEIYLPDSGKIKLSAPPPPTDAEEIK